MLGNSCNTRDGSVYTQGGIPGLKLVGGQHLAWLLLSAKWMAAQCRNVQDTFNV